MPFFIHANPQLGVMQAYACVPGSQSEAADCNLFIWAFRPISKIANRTCNPQINHKPTVAESFRATGKTYLSNAFVPSPNQPIAARDFFVVRPHLLPPVVHHADATGAG
jgi:hypothetical protein